MARKLRVLLIDDKPAEEPGSLYLELVRVPCDAEPLNGLTEPSISNWTQHLWLWSNDFFPNPDPDLVLIDCNYQDSYAPLLGKDPVPDPRGLLHGMIYIARLLGNNRNYPLGFSIYSQDASGFQLDPYAQFATGFLLAMLGDDKIGRRPAGENLCRACQDYLQKTFGGTPKTAWSAALKMYRARLTQLSNERDIFLHAPNCIHLTEVAAKAVSPDNNHKARALKELSDGLSLIWWSKERGREEVDLRSLFADCLGLEQCWTESATHELNQFLKRLTKIENDASEAADWTIARIKAEQRDSSRDGKLHAPERTKVPLYHQVLLISTWLADRDCRKTGSKKNSATWLAERRGISTEQSKRAFQSLGTTWPQVVKELDACYDENKPWPSHLPLMIRIAVSQVAERLQVSFPFNHP